MNGLMDWECLWQMYPRCECTMRRSLMQRRGVLALTETRATAAGQRVLSSIAREKGWTPFWGPPLQSRGGGYGRIGRRSCGICEERGAGEDAPPPLAQDNGSVAGMPWGSGRWIHVSVGTAGGIGMLEVQLVYGFQGKGAKNAALMDAALQYSA